MPAIAAAVAVMERIAPAALAAAWDNVGLLVDCGGDAARILVCLDITDAVVDEAKAEGCGLIVSHHPVIFHPLRRISRGDVVSRLLCSGISALCAHTNLDAAEGGVNDVLADLFGLTDRTLFAEVGRAGRLPQPTTAAALAAQAGAALPAQVRFVEASKPVRTLAVVGGSGSGLVAEAVRMGVDCVLTGEAGHHEAIDARHAGIGLLEAGHYATEAPIVPVLAKRLAAELPGAQVLVSRAGGDPFLPPVLPG